MTSRSATLEGHLSATARALAPEKERVAEAKERAKRLIEELRLIPEAEMFEVRELRPHGSHRRGTAIAGFKDVDYLLVLDPRSLRTQRDEERSPQDTVARLARLLRDRRAGLVAQGSMVLRSQSHSVGVKYPASGYRIDLVPALRQAQEKGCYRIPDKEKNDWVETRPGELERSLDAAEQRNPHVRNAVRLLKGWRRARGKAMQMPSYAIELIVTDLVRGRARTLEALVRGFFELVGAKSTGRGLVLLGRAERGAAVTVVDPASGTNVAAELDEGHRERLVENASRALESLDEAGDLLDEGRAPRVVLRKLFVGNHETNPEAT